MANLVAIIPKPLNIKFTGSYLDLNACELQFIHSNQPFLTILVNEINYMIGNPDKTQFKSAIPIKWKQTVSEEPPEAYHLSITENSIQIETATDRGLIWAFQSLRQLFVQYAHESRLPCLEIYDKPHYAWRGLLLDCCRHFMSVNKIKQILDVMSFYKMSILHWHLTEDQGWRIEIEAYPKLMEISAYRGEKAYGGYYSKAEIGEIISYARLRGIEIVPEIEMPGHCMAALSAYPELSCTGGPFTVGEEWGIYEDVYCAGKEETFTFLTTVLEEVFELFPSEYVHIGGDEVLKNRWKHCPDCQKRIHNEKLQNEEQLQHYFIQRINSFLQSHAKTLIGWDEILDGGRLENSVIHYWRAFKGSDPLRKALKENHKVVLSPTSHCYLDYAFDKIDLETVYALSVSDYNLSENEESQILGLQGNMWTEFAPQDIVVNKIFPRLIALAENAWTNWKNKDFLNFTERLEKQRSYLLQYGIKLEYIF